MPPSADPPAEAHFDAQPPDLPAALRVCQQAAARAVALIQARPPDVIVALWHGAAFVVTAVEAFWSRQAGASPLPPIVRANLGREKFARYEREPPPFPRTGGDGTFVGDYAEPVERGHFLFWLARQADWQAQLRELIQSAHPSPVRRILVLDDWVVEGSTRMLALGLLDLVVPAVETYLVTGEWDIRAVFGRVWLAERLPAAPASLEQAAYHIAPGTEDVAPDSLAWRPLRADNPHVQTLAGHLPLAEVLAFPAWAAGQVAAHVQAQPAAVPAAVPPPTPAQLDLGTRIMRWAWELPRLTPAGLAKLLGVEAGALQRELDQLVKWECLAHDTDGSYRLVLDRRP